MNGCPDVPALQAIRRDLRTDPHILPERGQGHEVDQVSGTCAPYLVRRSSSDGCFPPGCDLTVSVSMTSPRTVVDAFFQGLGYDTLRIRRPFHLLVSLFADARGLPIDTRQVSSPELHRRRYCRSHSMVSGAMLWESQPPTSP